MLRYFTDGSARPNPGPGGYAVILDRQPVALGNEPNGNSTTNIRMEGYAIIAALKHADGRTCEIYTDSEFWLNVITKWSKVWGKKQMEEKRRSDSKFGYRADHRAAIPK